MKPGASPIERFNGWYIKPIEKLEELPKPSRKMQRMTGSPEEEAQQIVQNMKKTLG